MSAPTEPILKMLRDTLKQRGISAAELASRAGIERSALRRALANREPMTLEQFIAVAQVLELGPESALDVPEEPDPPERTMPVIAAGPEAVVEDDDDSLRLEPWGNHPEQLARVGFELGCDFMLLMDVNALASSGVPSQVLATHEGRPMPIKFDAAYHRHNAPRFEDDALVVRVSLDAVYNCRLPWTSIKQVIFFPEPPLDDDDDSAEEPKDSGRPMLRLVT